MFVTVWEFQAREGSEAELLEANQPEGVWGRFFQKGQGYLGSEVLRDGRRLVTIDRWTSREAYEAFREATRAEYAAIDRRMERLTEHENHIGSFESV